MRIGMVCPYSLTIPGGVQSQVMGLARVLRRRGHETRVIAPCDGPPPAPFVTSVGPSVLNAANGSVAPIAPDPSAQLRTIRALWDEGFEVVHLHEPMVPGPAVTALLLKPAPLVGTFHAAGSQPAYAIARPLVRWAGSRLDEKVAVSEDARALVAPFVPGPWTVLFNGIDAAHFAGADPWPTEAPTVFFLGRHEPRKGLEVLLEAVADLPADCRVWVAGEGESTAALRARHRDPRIDWLGRIDDEERDRRLAGADVFCAPSLGGESFGIILLEAMASGTPVVASAIPGYTKVASTPVSGAEGSDKSGEPAAVASGWPGEPAAVLVEPGDARALAAALTSVLADAQRAAELRSLGLERAAQFDLDELADHYVDLYDRAVGSHA